MRTNWIKLTIGIVNSCIYVSKNWDFLKDDPAKKRAKGGVSILLKSCDDIICDMFFILEFQHTLFLK